MITVGASILLSLAAPQDPPVLGLVSTPDHRPLVDAEVELRPARASQLLVLDGLALTAARLTTRTGPRGGYRVPGEHGPGLLLVRHQQGLGALAAVFPGAPQRLLAEPMAALVSDSGPMRVWARATLPGLGGADLPVQEGEEIRLPAGVYQAWIESGGRLRHHRLTLVSGREHPVAAPDDRARLVELWQGFRGRVSPHSWPEVSLLEVEPGRFAVPDGTDRLEIRHEIPGGHAIHEIWQAGDRPVLRVAEPRRRRVAVSVRTPDGELSGAVLWALGRTAPGVQALCRVTTDRDGQAVLQLPTGLAVQLVTEHADWPSGTAPLDSETSSAVLSLSRPRTVRVRVEGPSGPGVVGARLELLCGGDDWGRLVAYTDDRGLARFERVPEGPAVVRLRDPRFLVFETHAPESSPSGDAEISFRADLGESISGRAVLPSGRPARRALITLRDPGGDGRLERTAATDERGHFRFTGLDADDALVLFASMTASGTTYSRQISDVRAGETERLVELRPEDPVPPHKRK